MGTITAAPSSATQAARAPGVNRREWSSTRRILFRCGFLYFGFYAIPLLTFPFAQMRSLIVLGEVMSPLTGITARVLGGPTPLSAGTLGGGDTLFEWLTHLTLLWLSILGAILWTLLDRSSKEHVRLERLLLIGVRYALGFVLIYYGMYKIVPFQFSFPGFARLVTPYGQTTPETLLWTFMGASQAYTAVVGVGELAAGVLLLFRRTALLGALLGVGVLLNIVLLNFFYIGGGKIFTVHLLLFALLIVAPSARLLTGVLLGTAGADSRSSSKPIPAVMYGGLAALIALVVMVRFGSQAQEARRNFGDLQPQSPLHGLYDVTEFALNGVPKPPLYTDPARWRRVAIESPRGMFVFGGDDSRRFLPTNVDASLGLVRTGRPGSPHEGTLRYSRTAEGWVLRGVFGADSLMVRLRRLDTAEFPLVRHQFRWVRDNEG